MLCLLGGPTWETTGLGKKMTNGLTCNDVINTNPYIKIMLFDPKWVRASKGGIM
jgi:hypothetical protein